MAIRDRIPPGVILLVLAPMIGELLSGSSPPSEFFTLFGFTIMTALWWGGTTCKGVEDSLGEGIGHASPPGCVIWGYRGGCDGG